MVKKIIRIYKVHDADLFWILEHYKFNFQKAVYCAVKGYMNEDPFVIELPEERKQAADIRKYYVVRNLVLSEERDADMIAFIEQIPKGHLNCALKNILRAYLMIPVAFAEKSNHALQKGRRRADAASYPAPKGAKKPTGKKTEKTEEKEALQEVSKTKPLTISRLNNQFDNLSDNDDLSSLFEGIISG